MSLAPFSKKKNKNYNKISAISLLVEASIKRKKCRSAFRNFVFSRVFITLNLLIIMAA